MARFEWRNAENEETNWKDDTPRKCEHWDSPISQATGSFNQDGYDTLTVVRTTTNDENGSDFNYVNHHEPPHGTEYVIQVVNNRNPQLKKMKKLFRIKIKIEKE